MDSGAAVNDVPAAVKKDLRSDQLRRRMRQIRATEPESTRTITGAIWLAAAGAVLAIAGGIWWAWDANPDIGKILLLVACVILGASYWTGHSPRRLPSWCVVGAAALVLLAAGYAIWAAIGTIVSQSTMFVG